MTTDRNSVPKTQDFIYATFTEVVCPVCEDSAIFNLKADAQQWARTHKADHIYSGGTK